MSKIKFEDGTIVNFNGTPTTQDIEEVAKKLGIKQKDKRAGYISGTLGLAKELIAAPGAVLSSGAKAIGGGIGALSKGDWAGFAEAGAKGAEEISSIPGQIYRGAKEGFFAESEMMSPGKALGLTGGKRLIVDILGDPTNILFGGGATKSAPKIANALEKSATKTGTKIYQGLVGIGKKDIKEYQALGRVFGDTVKEVANTTGRDLYTYGIKGNYDQMIKEMNTRIPLLKKQLSEKAGAITQKIDLSVVRNDLDKLAKQMEKIGEIDIAQAVKKTSEQLISEGEKITAQEAIELKRAYDVARQTASGTLSEGRAISNQIYKTIGDSLRKQINDIPELGKINNELETYLDTITSFSKKIGKEESRILPVKVGGAFPFIYLNLGDFPKLRTYYSYLVKLVAEETKIPLTKAEQIIKTYLPSTIRNLLEDKGKNE